MVQAGSAAAPSVPKCQPGLPRRCSRGLGCNGWTKDARLRGVSGSTGSDSAVVAHLLHAWGLVRLKASTRASRQAHSGGVVAVSRSACT